MLTSLLRRLALPSLALAASLSGTAAHAQQDPDVPTAPPPKPLPGAPLQEDGSLTTAVSRQAELEARVLWIDATANLAKISTREGIADIFEKSKRANINTVVLDVKPLSGHVLYDSQHAPRLTEWKGVSFPAGHDPLFLAMLEGRRRGIRVYASVNVFSEAHKLLKVGPLYEKRELQAITYDVERTLTAPDGATVTLSVAENQGPEDGKIAAYDARYREPRKLRDDEAAVVVTGEAVSSVILGSAAMGTPVSAPENGYVLIGRGDGARWLLEHIHVGNALTYTARDLLQPILDSPSELVGAFVNPANPESRKYMLRIIEELANKYALDGLVLDRMRYASLRTDFSPLSRQLFEEWLGKKLERFPHDVYAYDPVPGRPLVQGPYYKQWLEWRAQNIRTFLEEAKQVVQRVRRTMGLAVYVGSWYPDYYHVGVNWGATDYHAGLDWMSPEFNKTGYANLLNWITTGCYYPVATREEARRLGLPEDRTVQAAAETSVRAVNDASFVYAGLYLIDYQGNPEAFRKALEAARNHSQGVMLFDLVYIEQYNWWNILNEVFTAPRRAPHDVPGLIEAIQQTKKVLRAFRDGS